jgi:hypothetical protein
MSAEHRLQQEKERLEAVARWAERIETLKNRPLNPMSEKEFCDKHGLDAAAFNRRKKGHIAVREKTFRLTENALAAEGV